MNILGTMYHLTKTHGLLKGTKLKPKWVQVIPASEIAQKERNLNFTFGIFT